MNKNKVERASLVGMLTAVIIIVVANPYSGIRATIAMNVGTVIFIVCSWLYVFGIPKGLGKR